MFIRDLSNVNCNGDRASGVTRVTYPKAARTANTNFTAFNFKNELDITLLSFKIKCIKYFIYFGLDPQSVVIKEHITVNKGNVYKENSDYLDYLSNMKLNGKVETPAVFQQRLYNWLVDK